MYQLEDISCPQLYPRACICLMMYFKYNWNTGPFFYFMKMMSHAVNKKSFSIGSKSVEDEKKMFFKPF
jgi:hypothetical protein